MASSSSRSDAPAATRIEGGVALVAIGAVLLLVSLFLDWYQPGRSAWTVFEVWDLVLGVLALVALVAVAGRLRLVRSRPDSWLVGPSVVAFVIVVASLLNHPPAAIGQDPMIGIWLALVAAVLMLVGVALSVAQVSVAINVHRGAVDGSSVVTPEPTAGGTVTGARGRRFRRPPPVPAPSTDDGVAGSSRPPTSDPPTEATRVLDDGPTSRDEPRAPAR